MRFTRLAFAVPILLWLGGPVRADLAYETAIAGVADKRVAGELHDNSQLVKLQDKPPPSLAALRRRADDDIPQLRRVLEAAGYWAARIDIAIDGAADPAKVTVQVDPGPLYRLGVVVLTTPDGGAPPLLGGRPLGDFGLAPGDAARAAPVVAAEPLILAVYQENGHPFARIADRQVVVDDAARTMAVTYVVEAGPAARFGAPRLTGLKELAPGYVERRLAWRIGEPYDERKVAETRKRLVESNLFTVVQVDHAAQAEADGSLPMTLSLVERLAHSVGAGVEYSTSLGVGARAFWEDRNVFGNAEKLRVTADLAQSRLGAGVEFRRPDFLATDQDLLVGADLADESPPAYTTRHLRLVTGLERRLDATYTVGGSLAFERANVTAHGATQHYGLVGVPLFGRRDTTGSRLDPVKGSRLSLEVTPYQSIDGGGLSFLANRLAASLYRALLPDDRLVAAGFARLGSILGESRDRIPFDKRLYAGGGGSIRGYGFQRVGPLDGGDQPLGGRSSLEFGLELRGKVTESIGIAPFIEGGNVYAKPLPHVTGRYLYGAGLGLRYYTSVGPIRLDLATPLSRRPGDSPIQVYISLGQAF